MRKHRGFTLVELLIVIGIIALLMAIMVPALNRAKEHAKNMVCKSNLKQYGIAGRMYIDDNDGFFASPHFFLQAKRDSNGNLDLNAILIGSCQWCNEANWLDLQKVNEMGFMWPYFKNVKLHLCPTFKGYAKARGVQATGCTDGDNPQYSYSQNMFLGYDGWDYDSEERGTSVTNLQWGNKTTALKENQVLRPANIFYFSEENMWTITGQSDTVLNDTALLIKPAATGSDAFATYHFCPSGDVEQLRGSANIVFVDGHVGSVSAAEAAEVIDMVGHPKVPAACKMAWPRGEAEGNAL
ncbi:MAG: type II secretion system protein [Planctomycetes bacterium]|nr:type II secretion system protein [Planctomycetota bacterium]